ncbi:MAG: ExbD/TolR family protein [Candidatus Eisenbacteria bacterium]|nr:biopolymer transporter ExbD [Candidatus Eisenbacteria bacterium]
MAKAKHRVAIRIDMTPMVDVAFLLLIFFMSTTQFKPPEEVSVTLPESSSEIKVPETGIIVITANKSGKIFIGDESGAAGEVPKDELVNAIVTARSRRPGARVIVKGDKETDYGLIADVMDALQHTNTNRFNLMTELKTASTTGGENQGR